MSNEDPDPNCPPEVASPRPAGSGAPGRDAEQVAALLPLIYDQLHRLAEQKLRQERPGHTLQATALIHEVYCRLAGERRVPWESPGHFYAAAAEAMRRVLLDHAKARARDKRGGGRQRVPLDLVDAAYFSDAEEIVALDQAFCRFEQEYPDAAAVVRLRFFAGLSITETAQALQLSERTVNRRWQFARAWLFRELSNNDERERT